MEGNIKQTPWRGIQCVIAIYFFRDLSQIQQHCSPSGCCKLMFTMYMVDVTDAAPCINIRTVPTCQYHEHATAQDFLSWKY